MHGWHKYILFFLAVFAFGWSTQRFLHARDHAVHSAVTAERIDALLQEALSPLTAGVDDASLQSHWLHAQSQRPAWVLAIEPGGVQAGAVSFARVPFEPTAWRAGGDGEAALLRGLLHDADGRPKQVLRFPWPQRNAARSDWMLYLDYAELRQRIEQRWPAYRRHHRRLNPS